MTELPARGQVARHSAATLYEAAVSEWQHRTDRRHPEASPEVAVDSAIRPSWPGARLAGPAFTVRGAGGDNLARHRAVAAAPPNHILVADLAGSAYGHWGEVLAVAAQQRGILGLVIDGGVRDREELRSLNFPVFSRHDSVRGTGKRAPGTLNVAIVIGGVHVSTGDLVVGDVDGVVVLPRERVAAILDEADRRVAHEHDILTALRAGHTTLDLYQLG